MRRREFLMVIALLTISLGSAKGNPAVSRNPAPDERVPAAEVEIKTEAEESSVAMLSEAPSPLVSKDRALGAAYFNTLSILSATNECSNFFGGTAASVEVFKELISKVQKDYFTTQIGMQMSGETVNVRNASTKIEYRLFDKVRVNGNGPFYRRMLSTSNHPLPWVGTFEPNTKEARVLMFLHELGHVMKGEDGQWLLPNDGKDESLSRLNSQKIENVCGEQIKALRKREGKGDTQMSLAGKAENPTAKKRLAAPSADNMRLDQAYTVGGKKN